MEEGAEGGRKTFWGLGESVQGDILFWEVLTHGVVHLSDASTGVRGIIGFREK